MLPWSGLYFISVYYINEVSLFVASSLIEVLEISSLYQDSFFRFRLLHRYLRRIQLQSRTMESGCGTKVEPVITTCTKSTVIPPWMVLSSRCILRWPPVIGSVITASKLSRQPLFLLSFARGKVPSNSMTLRSSSHWCLGRWGHQPGSLRPLTKHPGQTCLCNLLEQKATKLLLDFCSFLFEGSEGINIITSALFDCCYTFKNCCHLFARLHANLTGQHY